MCPCKDCEKRTAACHAKCTDYIEWQKWHNEKADKERKESGNYPTSYGGWVRTLDGYWRNYKTKTRRRR